MDLRVTKRRSAQEASCSGLRKRREHLREEPVGDEVGGKGLEGWGSHSTGVGNLSFGVIGQRSVSMLQKELFSSQAALVLESSRAEPVVEAH